MSTVRDRIRAETLDEIKTVARRQLAAEGADLSLRAVARELGMVSSAIYRYFASRDDLLTALIVEGYSALADHVETADRELAELEPAARFAGVGRAIRTWAHAHRAEYALLYGSPVPGYVAPPETVIPVVRMSTVMIDILRDGFAAGRMTVNTDEAVPTIQRDLAETLLQAGRPEVPPELLARGFTAWASLFGVISFELFGHSVGITSDYDALFHSQVSYLARMVEHG